MATDAEIVAWHRQEAARFRQHVLDGRREAAERRAAGQIDVFGDAYADQESVYEQRHARAADAIEENARLRALLGEARNAVLRWSADPNHEPGDPWRPLSVREMVAKIDAALGGCNE